MLSGAGRAMAARQGGQGGSELLGQQQCCRLGCESCCASLPALGLAIFLRGKWVIADQLIPSALLLSE